MIFVNARFLTQSVTGVQRYAIEISRVLKKLNPDIQFVAPHNVIHQDLADELQVKIIGKNTGHLWEQFDLPMFLRKQGKPLLISLGTTAPIFYHRKVVTVHDLAFLHFPEVVSWKFRTFYKFVIPRILKSSLHLTTVSEFSKNDFCSSYGVPRDRISVVSNASSFSLGKRIAVEAKEKVIIAVGSIQPNKNIEALVSAFSLFKERKPSDYVLKLVGGLDKRVFQDTKLLAMIRSRSDIALTGYLSDADLLALYSSSTCFVFPSLFEGFGIPPLEAMACGCPVIASTAASIPEVCGEAALYIDPRNIEDMAQKIDRLVGDQALQESLIEKGYENIKRFDWDECGAAFWNIAKKYA